MVGEYSPSLASQFPQPDQFPEAAAGTVIYAGKNIACFPLCNL